MRLRVVETRGMRREFRPEQVESTPARQSLTATIGERLGDLTAAKPTGRGVLLVLPSLREQVRRHFVEARTGST